MNSLSALQEAVALQRAGRLIEAEQLCLGVLQATPDLFQAHHLLGMIQLQQGRAAETLTSLEAALASLDRAVAAAPDDATAWYNRGMLLRQMKRPEAALQSYERALAIRPNDIRALNNRGNVLRALRRHGEALDSFEKGLALKPDDAGLLARRTETLLNLERWEDALASFDTALARDPQNAELFYNRGDVLFSLKRFAEAAADFKATLALRQDHPYAFGSLAGAALQLCDWKHTGQLAAEIAAHPEKFVSPLTLLGYSEDPARLLAGARRATRAWVPDAPPPLWNGAPYAHDKIRLAYLSADFSDHATAWLTAELFESHDRQRFHLTALAFRPDDGSAMRARLAKAFDRFIDVSGHSDEAAAQLLREMEIDIAIDLNGHTRGGRPAILSFRPAPVQVNYLGFPGSMGAPFIDYVIADPVLLPLSEQAFYDEQIVHLPDSYQPNDTRRVMAATPSRGAAGLPATGFIFCCFNNSWKITEPLFDIWMGLLKAVPGSVLWLLDDNQGATANLKTEAEKRGIDPGRLVFAPRTDQPAHLARHRLADIFLDTLPCNAHTTASDALWAGLPVLTCRGKSFAGRVAASLLHAAGLAELALDDLDGYAAFALALALEPKRLQTLRQKLEGARTTPLFNIERYRRNIETAYTQMWHRAENGTPPSGFAVGPSGF